MRWIGLNELREKFLTYFEEKNHIRMESFPLIPQGDKSLLLINSGMAPLKPYFTGEKKPPNSRVVTCQKCIRVDDIENVGKTARHGTFFEMLGNFSFGDYFKVEALTWSWEFLTKVLEIPEEILYPSVYIEDDETFDIWTKVIGVSAEKIVRLGKKDNFWELGVGACGPCSEIYFDRGEKYGCGSSDCKPGCDCDRYMEIWNNVFSQFYNDGAGNYSPLKQKNIDTGMGLERLALVIQGVTNFVSIDTIKAILDKTCAFADYKYGTSDKQDNSACIITDHIRSTVFLAGDGVNPSNEGRGYVMRKLLRRAARHGKMLGIKGAFLHELCDTAIILSCKAYPNLAEKRDIIKRIIKTEEERFEATIDSGLAILAEMNENLLSAGNKILSGEAAFKLYDTYGFPVDLIREINEELGIELDLEGFNSFMEIQKNRARAARRNISGWTGDKLSFLSKDEKTEFVGYVCTTSSSTVLHIISSDDSGVLSEVDSVTEGEVSVILDRTPFYAESGGQVGDTGKISTGLSELSVLDTKKTPDGQILHICKLETGELKKGISVTAEVDSARRNGIARNHSSAHLLHAALRTVLGKHVEQAGSFVDEFRLRFDFSHFSGMTAEELSAVEKLVNDNILAGLDIVTKETGMTAAKEMGAMALFGEKYGDVVRVVKMGEFSTELCGGTHLKNTSGAGLFKILSESSVAAGVRRIEATTGYNILELINIDKAIITGISKLLKAQVPADIAKKAEGILDELKNTRREIGTLTNKLSMQKITEVMNNAKLIGNCLYINTKFDDMSFDAAKNLAETIRGNRPAVVVLIAVIDGVKLNFVAACGSEAITAGANAGALIKQIATISGGAGGGRAENAVCGGKDITKVDEALAAGEGILRSMIKV